MTKKVYWGKYTGPPDSYVPGIPRSEPFPIEGAEERDRLLAGGNVKLVDPPTGEDGEPAPREEAAPAETTAETTVRRRREERTPPTTEQPTGETPPATQEGA